jgi:head-tail adaptor
MEINKDSPVIQLKTKANKVLKFAQTDSEDKFYENKEKLGEDWYYYDKEKHRWRITTEGSLLRIILSKEICKKFMDRSIYWSSINNNSSEEQKELNAEKSKKSIKIALQLKNASFKDSIMRELRCLFMDEKFDELLDSRSHLIGFNPIK